MKKRPRQLPQNPHRRHRRKRICITGGAGFIGVNLARYLCKRGYTNITVYDHFAHYSKRTVARVFEKAGIQGKVRLIKGDITDYARIRAAVKGHFAVVHLAAHTRVVESLKAPSESFRINAIGTFNCIEAARVCGVQRFIFASSNAAVGEHTRPISEHTLPEPISPYGALKLFGETLCGVYFRSYGLQSVSLRFANAYGPFSGHKPSVVAQFIRRIKEGKPLFIYGDGKQTRDLTHVDDICQAIFLCIRCADTTSRVWGQVFQVGTGKETRMLDLAKMVQKTAVTHQYRPGKIIFKDGRSGEIIKNFSNINKIKKTLGFHVNVSLKNGLSSMFDERINVY